MENVSVTAFDIARGIGYLTVQEVDAIKRVVKLLPRHAICVNIGSGAGTSVIAVLEERPDLTVYDVDLTLENGAAQLRETGFNGALNLHRIEGDSKEIGRLWLGGEIDYLFIDGDHSPTGIMGDYDAWLPHMRPGSFILVHDYWPYPPGHKLAGRLDWPAVAEVTDAVLLRYAVLFDCDRLRVFEMVERPL